MALTTRQWRLKDFLESHFVSGHYFSIREICDSVTYSDGSPCYKYDDRPTSHDRCVALGNDVRSINWEQCEGWKLIIKDKQGGVKLAESKAEFDAWWQEQHDALENRYKLLSTMKSKADRDGIMPIFNMKLNPADVSKPLTPIDSYVGKHYFALVDELYEIVNVAYCDSVEMNYSKRLAKVIGGECDGKFYQCDYVREVKTPREAEIQNFAFMVLKGGEENAK